MTPEQIGQRIRERRKLLQITQGDLALLADCSKPTVAAAEQGKPTLRLDKLTAILHVLGLAIEIGDEKCAPVERQGSTLQDPEADSKQLSRMKWGIHDNKLIVRW